MEGSIPSRMRALRETMKKCDEALHLYGVQEQEIQTFFNHISIETTIEELDFFVTRAQALKIMRDGLHRIEAKARDERDKLSVRL